MKKQLDNNLWKAITISTMWLCVAISSFNLGFFTILVAFVAFSATLCIVEA